MKATVFVFLKLISGWRCCNFTVKDQGWTKRTTAKEVLSFHNVSEILEASLKQPRHFSSSEFTENFFRNEQKKREKFILRKEREKMSFHSACKQNGYNEDSHLKREKKRKRKKKEGE